VEWEGKGKGKRERECYTRRSGWWWPCARDINKAGPKSGVEIFCLATTDEVNIPTSR
jgi:hypothetical protein